MSKPAKKVKLMIPYFWTLFIRYQNDISYFMQHSDVMASKFCRGETDVKEFIEQCNKYAEKQSLGIHFEYKEQLTYVELLNQLNNEQI